MRQDYWKDKEIRMLTEQYATCVNPRDLAVKIGRSYKAMQTMSRRLGLKRIAPKPILHCTATKEEDRFIQQNNLTMPVKTMAKALNRSHTFVRERMDKLNIYSKEVAQRFAKESRYTKGSISFNKGLKWKDFMSKEGMKNSRKTTFKKGTLPPNTLYDGAIRTRRDKTGIEYQYIRTGLARWQPLHRLVWSFYNGKIPPRKLIVFKDGNQGNCNIENLEMITMEENMKRNTYHNYPKDIALTIQLTGALTRQINKHLKKLTA